MTFIDGLLIGSFIGLAIGAAWMYHERRKAVDEYVIETLDNMRDEHLLRRWP